MKAQTATSPYYSIVVPVYQSATTLSDLLERLQAFADSVDQSVELILVDDCSEDDSWQMLKTLKQQSTLDITLIRLMKNVGQQRATLCGVLNATGQWVVTIDDDLQNDPMDIQLLLEKQQQSGADLVYGVYPNKRHNVFRKAGSRFVNWFFEKYANTYGRGTSFRLFKRKILQHYQSLYDPYFLLDEVLAWHTSHVSFTEVSHYKRTNGGSNYSLFRLVLITFNYMLNYTVIPLRMMTYGGLIVSIITFILGLKYIYDKLFKAVELGFTSQIVAIFFSTSVILFCLGIIGEYISRIYNSQRVRPQFVILEKIS